MRTRRKLLLEALESRRLLAGDGLGVTFSNASSELDFVHRSFEFQGDGLAGAAWFDYDNDNQLDLFLTNGRTQDNALYRNLGDGTFEDVTAVAGVASGIGSAGVVAGDIDNDGFVDLLLTGDGGIMAGVATSGFKLYHNNGDGTFTDITALSGIVEPETSASAALADIDNDGFLDLFITAPGSLATRAQHDSKLFYNNGDLTFTDITAASGVDAGLGACATGFSDYDGDGDVDLFVSNCNDVFFAATPIQLFRNDGDLQFTDVTSESGLASELGFWMATSFADYDNDGDFDLFATNSGASDGGVLSESPHGLFQNQGDGTFVNVADSAGVANWEFGWGAAFNDLDNDGYADLFFTGSLPPLGIVGPGQGNPGRLFFNNNGRGNDRFTEASENLGIDLSDRYTSGVAHGDYNNDGFVDFVIMTDTWSPTSPGDPELFLNDGNGNHWLGIQLYGTVSNRDGVGARVTVETEALTQAKEVYAGSSVLSMDSQSLRFGLGQSDSVSRIQVNWPSGLVETFPTTAGVDRIANLVEGAGTVVLPRTTGLFFNKPGASDGYTLFSPNQTTSTYLMDKDGNIINEWQSEYTPGLHAYLLPDGSLVRPANAEPNSVITATGGGGLIERFDWNGNKVWEFDYNDDSTFADAVLQHHDIEIMPNGNILMIAWKAMSAAEAEQAGRDNTLPGGGAPLFPDQIIEVQPDLVAGVGGTIVWQWNAIDHLVQDHDPTKDNYFGETGVADHPELIDFNYVSDPAAGGGAANDWLHANGLDYNADLDQIVLSSREFSEVWIIDHSTTTAEAAGNSGGNSGKGGDLLYRWGNPQTYDAGDANDRQLFFQHDPKWIEPGQPGEGNITIFNNGWGGPNLSSVNEIQTPVDEFGNYALTPGQSYGPATPVFSYTAAPEDYSQIISGTQRLENGNTLITFGGDGTFVEITPEGQEVWRYTNPYTAAGMLGPTDPIPGPIFVDLNANFVFRATDYELDSIWSVDVSASSINEDAAVPESVVYKLSGIVLENEQSSVQIELQENGDDLDNFFPTVADAVSRYSGPGILEFNVDTGILIYTGGAGGSLMADLVVPIQPVNDDVFEYTESVEFVIANPFSATGAKVKLDLDRSLGSIDIVDDDGTALDRYVNKPDSSYAFSLADTIVSPGITTYIIDMTSQTWRTPEEVDKPAWQHWVQIIVPDNPVSDTAVLVITSGENYELIPTEPDPLAAQFSLLTNQIVVNLTNVPSQPLKFADETFSRREDEIIAYTLDKFLDGGDEEWPLLLPMVKSAVRAMDTAQEFLADNSIQVINDFVVTGGSKRGWTTWLTAAVDPRVSGIVPVVIDVLNMELSIANHKKNYEGVTVGVTGGYSDAIKDYTNLNIFDRFGTPRADQMLEIVDPYSYRDRLTMPKYLLNGSGDPFFTPDSSQFYIHDLIGPTYLRYVPNAGHGLNDEAIASDAAFIAALNAGAPLPEFNWTVEGGNENVIRVNTVDRPLEVKLWQATNPDSLDFRIETFGPGYTSTTLLDQGGGEYVGSVPSPATGGTAFFVELTYLVNGIPFKFTTEARIAEPNLDFGDAPDSYGTLLDDDGARHVIDDSHLPRLGALVDSEDDGQPIDNDDVGVDDEDGLQIGTFFDGVSNRIVFTDPDVDPNNVLPNQLRGVLNPLDPAGTDVSVWVTGAGILDGWIDFDQNGAFDDGEQVFDSLPVSGDSVSGTFVDLNIKTPVDASDGTTWMRLRISNSGGIAPDGLVIGGEVEDYLVEVLRFTDVPDGQNEPPVFDIDLPLSAGPPTLDILERDDSVGTVIDGFLINIYPGNPTSLDEILTQTVTVSIDPIGGATNLMTRPPVLTADGQLTVYPAPDAVGTASYRVTVTDNHSTPLSSTEDFDIRIQPVNDRPEIDPTVLGRPVVVNPDDGAQSYFVESDGTIRYSIREDNTQRDGTTEPFFIPLSATTTDPFGPIGLLDVLTVGPDNESDDTPGGSQSLSLVSPSDENGQQIIGFDVLQLTDNNVIDENPQISGSNVVWQSGSNSFPFNREIYFWDGTTTTQVTDNDFTDRDPQVSGNNITWWGYSAASEREIFFWNADTGEIQQVTDDSIRDENPQISGSTVVWEHRANGNFEVYRWDGSSPQDGPVNVSNSPLTDSAPQIDGSNVVYQISGNGFFAIGRSDGVANEIVSISQSNAKNPQLDGDYVVWEQFYSLGRDTEILLFDGSQTIPLTDNDFNDFEPQVSGDNVVWRGGRFGDEIEIYLYDGVTTKQITDNDGEDWHPQIDGNIVVWQGNDGQDDEIFAWDGTSITQLTDNDYSDQFPQVSGNRVVWQALSKGSGDGLEIFQAELKLGYMATEQGGTLTPVFDGSELIGWNYIPPADFNFSVNPNVVFDSFTYEVSDDGKTYDQDTGELLADPQTRTNQVHFVLSPINDAPVFDLLTDNIVVAEDGPQISLPNFATNIGGGPIGTATDENDLATLQALAFHITPLDFDVAEMSTFFSSEPVLDAQTGQLSFQTADNVFGSYQFEIRLEDDGANDPSNGDVNQSAPQLLTINVLAHNDPLAIKPDSAPVVYTLNEDGTVEIEIDDLLNVFDPGPLSMFGDETANVTPGGNQTVTLADPISSTTSAAGTLQLLTTGGPPRLLYTPPINFNGTDTFVYTVTDDGVTVGLDEVPFADPLTATNTVTLNVNPVNNPPEFSLTPLEQSMEDAGRVTVDDWASNVQAGPINATDETSGPSAQRLSFQIIQVGGDANLILPGSISATINPLTQLASLSYQSAPDANGTATFQVVLRDDGPSDTGNGDRNVSEPQLFVIDVTAVNDSPSFNVITSDPVSVAEDRGPQTFTRIANIIPGPVNEQSQSVVIEVQPLAAEFASLFSVPPTIDNNGILHFTTAPDQNTDNANGPVPVQFLARDSEGGQSALFDFQIEVSEVNDRPVANSDSFNTDENTVFRFNVADLLANDIDPDLDSNANEVVRVQLAAQSQTPGGALLLYNELTGQVSYDPTNVASMQELTTGDSVSDSFTYSLIDAAALVSETVTVSLNIAGVNDAPILVPDIAFLETEGSTSINVLANDRDIDGSIDPTSVQIVGEPEFGIIVITATGVILYTPFVVTEVQHSFSYTVADNLGLRSEPLTVMISTNPAPTTGDDVAGTFHGEAIQVNVLANDSDADGLDLGSLVIVREPEHGQATVQSDGTVLYEPDADFVGSDSFTYQVSDTLGRPSRITTVNTQVVNSRLQNPRKFEDVNADGNVTALDALLIINHLRDLGNASEIPVLDSDRGPNYYDVNGNQVITASDALRVINSLAAATVESEAEQRQPLLALATPTAQAPDFAHHRSETDLIATNLIGPNKIVDTTRIQRVSRDPIDTISPRRIVDQEEDAVRAAIDEVMANLI